MTVPQEWIERVTNLESRWWLYLLLVRVGIKTNFMGPPDDRRSSWYFGFMFYWFAVFFNWNYLNGTWVGNRPGRFWGISIYWRTKFHLEPGELFWRKTKHLGRY